MAKLGDIARTVEHGIDIMDDANVTIDALESGVRIRDKQQRAAIMQKFAQRATDEPPAPPPVCSPAYNILLYEYIRNVDHNGVFGSTSILMLANTRIVLPL